MFRGRTQLAATVTVACLVGCNGTPPIVEHPSMTFLAQCLSKNVGVKDELIFMGPTTFQVGDVWRKRVIPNSPPQYVPRYVFATEVNKEAVEKSINIGANATCSTGSMSGGGFSLDVAGNATAVAVPFTAELKAGLKNAAVSKISAKSLRVDTLIEGPYLSAWKALPDNNLAKAEFQKGTFYFSRSMVLADEYTVEISHETDGELGFDVGAKLPERLTGDLKADVLVTRKGNNTLLFSVLKPVYIAAVMSPMGKGLEPSSAVGGSPESTPANLVVRPAEITKRGGNAVIE